MNVKAWSNETSSQTASVSAKSASLSPGKPTITSVVSASPGTASRSCCASETKRSRE